MVYPTEKHFVTRFEALLSTKLPRSKQSGFSSKLSIQKELLQIMRHNINCSCLQTNCPSLNRSSAGDDSEIWEFAQSWIRKFRNAKQDNAAEKLIYLWVTINAWASMVVPERWKNQQDSYLVKSMAADQQFKRSFAELYSNRTDFKRQVDELVSLAPVFQVIWLRNNNVEYWREDQGETRSEFIKRVECLNPYYERGNTSYPAFAPGCALSHLERNNAVPSNWPHILSMIYQVRCNLFHGGKNYESSRDTRFIELAYSILWKMWEPEIPEWMRNSVGENTDLPTHGS